ncbi:hypothetical protein BCR43DRAFT_500436 [Syncephalastrum racemosum]|uniref:Uncharacterized protein n=1 Tax=Syncephalastrum racemosum TaxID=13706 RepID=A0A1X2HSB9_SYNRA|nr:hypothetical protein BCR43DRAFT_500436 [Syncephalastrum racemosum]
MTTLLLPSTTCETTQQTQDAAAWPSRYYGRTRRIDLQQIYTDLVNELQQQERPQRRVSFSVAPPKVHVYEPVEYEDDDEEDSKPFAATRFIRTDEAENFSEIYCKKKKANKYDSLGRRYDLRPVPNVNYTKKEKSASAPSSPVSDKPIDLSGALSEEPAIIEGVVPSVSTPPRGHTKRARLLWLNKTPSFASLRRKMTI